MIDMAQVQGQVHAQAMEKVIRQHILGSDADSPEIQQWIMDTARRAALPAGRQRPHVIRAVARAITERWPSSGVVGTK